MSAGAREPKGQPHIAERFEWSAGSLNSAAVGPAIRMSVAQTRFLPSSDSHERFGSERLRKRARRRERERDGNKRFRRGSRSLSSGCIAPIAAEGTRKETERAIGEQCSGYAEAKFPRLRQSEPPPDSITGRPLRNCRALPGKPRFWLQPDLASGAPR